MADEPLLLNFVVDNAQSRKPEALKSSRRWTDRARDRKRQKRNSNESSKSTVKRNSGTNGASTDYKNSQKEKVINPVFDPRKPAHELKGNKRDNTFVTSLFTGDDSEHFSQDVGQNLEDNQISNIGTTKEASNAPIKTTNFAGVQLDTQLADHLNNKMNISAPTAIQSCCLPALLNTDDKDAFIEAQTGSGKTLAYLLPIVQRLIRLPKNLHTRTSGIYAVIMAPTRELCQQIYNVANKLNNNPLSHWIVSCNVIGGEKKKSEKARIRKGVNILIGTPGRLADHLENTEALDVSQVRWVVLDEGDRLMDMGFEETLTKILSYLESQSSIIKKDLSIPSRKVTMLCSATMKDTVKRLSDSALKDALYLKSSIVEETNDGYSQAPEQLLQRYVVVPPKLRLVSLVALLRSHVRSYKKIIIFLSCSDSVDFHFEAFRCAINADEMEEAVKEKPDSEGDIISNAPALRIDGKSNVYRLHGSLSQQIRTSTLNLFSSSEDSGSHILLCTDVAARGLDLPNVDLVVQYDAPFSTDDYLHRIGRTARAGHNGAAIMFLLPKESEYINLLKSSVSANILEQPNGPSGLLSAGFSQGKTNTNDWQDRATEWQLELERFILENEPMRNLAKRAFTSYVRAYATHLSSERSIFNMRDLHLGHIAKSFALREAPGKISGANSSKPRKQGGSVDRGKSKSSKDIAALMHRKAMEHYSTEHNIG
ncbi:ATP-dependent RNA helicase dbp7 [Schizosaccharomyces pombe]